MFQEFKDFIKTGNVIEFTVSVIMAGAVGNVMNGFVDQLIMPVIGQLIGGIDFSQFKIVLSPAVTENGKVITPENAIRYGAWINSVVNLLIIGFAMFLVVRSYNKFQKKDVRDTEAYKLPTQEELLMEIRDLLKNRQA
jgi:large conductance mechanosensitive channel